VTSGATYKGKDENENRDSQIHPLDILQRGYAVLRLLKEGIASENRTDDGANSIKRLSEVDANLGIPWRTVDGKIWICRCLQASQSRADNESSTAKAAKRSVDSSRPPRFGQRGTGDQGVTTNIIRAPTP
jgi:hypothetical protein